MRDAIRSILAATLSNGSGHIPSALSILDILDGLYSGVLGPGDRFILSKGHGALALYAVLGMLGEYSAGYVAGHPERGGRIEFSSGSLGHGLGVAAGMALCGVRRVFCLVGDGECQEGSIWEAARIISSRKLPIVCIVDANGTHDPGGSIAGAMFGALGWHVIDIDGHDREKINGLRTVELFPAAVIAHTVKGHGVAEMEADPAAWHHRAPTLVEYERMTKQ